MDMKRVHLFLIGLHIAGFVCAIVVLGVTGTAWSQALVIEVDAIVRSFWRMSTWGSGGRTGNYVSNYISLIYATAALGLYWNLMFGLLRLLPQLFDKTMRKLSDSGPNWARWPFWEMVTAAAWWVMWLASAAGVSSTTEAKAAATKEQSGDLSALQALMAFLWLGWFIWTAILILSALQYRNNRTNSLPHSTSAPPVPADTKTTDIEAGQHTDTTGCGGTTDKTAVAMPANATKDPVDMTKTAEAAADKAAFQPSPVVGHGPAMLPSNNAPGSTDAPDVVVERCQDQQATSL